MIELEEFKNILSPHIVPKELEKLIEFQNVRNKFYSSNFEVTCNDGKSMLGTYSTDTKFQKSFVGFANADRMGSQYMFWLRDEKALLLDSPIVVFGGEGGFHVIASNLKEFLQLLSCDMDPMISWSSATYFEDEYTAPSDRHEEYLEWLSSNNILAIENPKPILKKANSQHQDALNEFVKIYYS